MKARFYMTALAAGILSAGLTAGVAHAACANPFGGEDPGCIPPDAPKGPIAKCESGIAKSGGKLVGAIIKCHIARAAGKLVDDAAEDACEAKAKASYAKTKTDGCTGCTQTLIASGDSVETQLDAANALVYCTAGTPFGGDDPGNIPADPAANKCAAGVAKSAGKLIAALINCHIGRVGGKYVDANAEELCESTAFSKFAATKTVDCDPCVSIPTLQSVIHSTVDTTNGDTYCASPSGAFVD